MSKKSEKIKLVCEGEEILLDNLDQLKEKMKLNKLSEDDLDKIFEIQEAGPVFIMTNPYDMEINEERTLLYAPTKEEIDKKFLNALKSI